MKSILFATCLFLTTLLFIACTEQSGTTSEEITSEEETETPQSKPIYNPNGDSELALLMRAMHDNAAIIKSEIEAREPRLTLNSFDGIHTATATDPSVRTATFKEMSLDYQQKIEALKNAPQEALPQMYNEMIRSCMSCHTTFCPGPKMKIKKLFIPKVEIEQVSQKR